MHWSKTTERGHAHSARDRSRPLSPAALSSRRLDPVTKFTCSVLLIPALTAAVASKLCLLY